MAYAGTPEKRGRALAAGPIEQSIVRLLSDGKEHSSAELLDEVYRGTGKPPSGADSIVRRARRTLSDKGYDIRQVSHRRWQMFAMPVLIIRRLGGKAVPVHFEIEPRYRTILEAVSRASGISVEDIRGESRKLEISRARWLVVDGMRSLAVPQREIARLLGYADHSSVLHAMRQITTLRQLGFGDAAILRGDGPRRRHATARRADTCRPLDTPTDLFAAAWKAHDPRKVYPDAKFSRRVAAL
jgi:hypothetical protein